MHELGIAKNIIKAVLGQIEGQAGRQVSKICVRVGKLQAVVPESLQASFELLAQGTPLEGVVLEVEEEPLKVSCKVCGAEFAVNEPIVKCPQCGGQLEIIGGKELVVEAVELA